VQEGKANTRLAHSSGISVPGQGVRLVLLAKAAEGAGGKGGGELDEGRPAYAAHELFQGSARCSH